jgi:RNA polymerase sigma-70 factor (ECF subfamily)
VPRDEDRDLVRRVADGSEHALGTLFDRWATLVNSVAMRIVNDPDEAEAVVEDTFWQAWRQADRYEGERASVAAWLGTTARSCALDHLRARRRSREEPWSHRRADHPSVESSMSAARGADSARDARHTEQRERIARALESLSPEQRETILLAYFGGLSHSEIAERCGLPLGTVKTRTRLAIEQLRGLLATLDEGARR